MNVISGKEKKKIREENSGGGNDALPRIFTKKII